MNRAIVILAAFLLANTSSAAQSTADRFQPYTLVWTSQSANSSESMPCGGGSIGLNVWVEKDDLLMYVSKTDAFDENNGLLKAGRLRVRLEPNPFVGTDFRQTLRLYDGYVEVTASGKSGVTKFKVWVDVHAPVVHCDIQSDVPRNARVTYESWRTETFKERPGENFQNSYKWAPFDTIYTYKDSIAFQENTVCFFHRNREFTVFDANVRLQGLDEVRSDLYNPMKHLVFGGLLEGEGLVADGLTTGRYVDADFAGWALRSARPVRTQAIRLVLHTAHAEHLQTWSDGLQAARTAVRTDLPGAHERSMAWWHAFWDRSFICVDPGKVEPDSGRWQVGRNYQLFRYMLGCNAYGSSPTKFNGGLFTFDPVFVDSTKPFTADYRNWCGGTMTAQNQRLVHYPMLKSGDTDMMKPQFDFYLHGLRNAEIRTERAWGHKGAGFTEQIENYGLSNPAEYSWERPAGFDKGMDYNKWLEYLWDTSLEFCFMILETERYAGRDVTGYIPLIESCLTFFDEHYQCLAKQRGHQPLDGDGKLVLYPSSACETFKMAYNATPTIAALRTVLQHLLALPPSYLTAERRAHWLGMLARIPPMAFQRYDGVVTIAPAVAYARVQNEEAPQLYPVFPWGIYGVGKPGLDTAVNTWYHDPFVNKFRSHVGWKQDVIFAARLGLTSEAADLIIKKLGDSGGRFPAFWGPGFDWTPDHNWGGSGMIGLQEMLLQTTDDRIFVLPAWPSSWDVDFKLHAPRQTVVEVSVRGGKLRSLKVTPEIRRNDVIVNPLFARE